MNTEEYTPCLWKHHCKATSNFLKARPKLQLLQENNQAIKNTLFLTTNILNQVSFLVSM